MLELAPGLIHVPDYLDRARQEAMIADVRGVVRAAPLFTPVMPRTGKAFSVRMTNCGTLGWVSDRAGGYRYQAIHPVTEDPWPPIPDSVMQAWRDLAGCAALPEACLVNFYDATARMGLHRDADEQALEAPVISLSLGDDCLFRFGGLERMGKTKSIRLRSGDAVVIGGASRLCHHGVDRIYPQTSTLLPNGGRINLTLRRVAPI